MNWLTRNLHVEDVCILPIQFPAPRPMRLSVKLRAAGFFRGEISVLLPCQGTVPEFAVAKYSKAPENPLPGNAGDPRMACRNRSRAYAGIDAVDQLRAHTGCVQRDGEQPSCRRTNRSPHGVGDSRRSRPSATDRRIRNGNILISTHAMNATEVAVATEDFCFFKAEDLCLAEPTPVSPESRSTEPVVDKFSEILPNVFQRITQSKLY